MQQQERSKTLQELYPIDLMMEAFGTVSPSNLDRATYFFDKWCEWKNHTLKITDFVRTTMDAEAVCRQLGLKNLWHFQIRGFYIRFCDVESMAFFKMAAAQRSNNV